MTLRSLQIGKKFSIMIELLIIVDFGDMSKAVVGKTGKTWRVLVIAWAGRCVYDEYELEWSGQF